MVGGYVYILINSAMPGLVKIGSTVRDSRSRARELYTTGVPTPFEVAFEIFSEDAETLESTMHSRLLSFRVNGNREFFRYPLLDAVNQLINLAGPSSKSDSLFSALSILARLNQLYPRWIDPEIVDAQIVQTHERVWLEITKEEVIAGYLKNQTIRRVDLAFITVGAEGCTSTYFRPDLAITENVRNFTEKFDAYSVAMTTRLFHDAGAREVCEKLNPHRDGFEQPRLASAKR